MAEKRELLGIIGGMGAQATACFYDVLHNQQSVASEQEYLDILLYSKPSIPDRTAFITGKSTDSPLEHLIHAVKMLESADASCIVIPCATSHFFFNELVKAVEIPILNMLDETARYVKECRIKNVCLLATDGTLEGGYFQKAFEKCAITVTVPSERTQADLMDIIYDIKRGDDVSPEALESIITEALTGGAEAVVLGCTELCVITNKAWERNAVRSVVQNSAVINILEVLAEASLSFFRDQNKCYG